MIDNGTTDGGARTIVSPKDFTPADIAAAIGSKEPTSAQEAVISGPTEPTLVVAGAGAGKTETMAARVVYLVATERVRPGQILGLTFTRKAAQQLARRVQERLDAFARSEALEALGAKGREIAETIRTEQPRIATYDSFAGDILASHGLLVPVEPDTELIGETDLYILTHSIVSEWDHALPWSVGATTERAIALAEQIASHLETTETLRADPNVLEEFLEGHEGKLTKDLSIAAEAQENRRILLDVVDALSERLAAEGKLTFGMRMAHAATLARDVPAVAAAERRITTAVLLDEYQDTGQAQRVMLMSLFGGSEHPPLAVTAVGDPMQSIYGWRGASASNLDSFLTDFPRVDGPAGQNSLSKSWRNPPEVLGLANHITAELRGRGSEDGAKVPQLEPKDEAEKGYVRIGLFGTVDSERKWIADQVYARYRDLDSNGWKGRKGDAPPTAAVLVRRNVDAEPLARVLRETGLEVDVLSSGGLLDVPEVADLLALVRVALDPGDDESSIRLLTGHRFRLGAADLRELSGRAREISLRTGKPSEEEGERSAEEELRAELGSLSELENVDAAGLADAAVNPGAKRGFTERGREAIAAFAAAVRTVRERLDQGPAHVLGIAETALGLDVEVRLRAELGLGEGRQQLDALSRAAADFASHPDAGVKAFIDYIDVARTVERGLAKDIVPQPGRVQILTVHSAKGLEWQIVAVPHVARERFTKKNAPENWVRNAWELPAEWRGDRRTETNPGGVPVLELDEVGDHKELDKALKAYIAELKSTVSEEERRLFYVAMTRSEQSLLVSAHHWTPERKGALGPAVFLEELRESIEDRRELGIIDAWEVPAPDEENPLAGDSDTAQWPEEDGDFAAADPAAPARVRAAGEAVAAAAPLAVPDDVPLPEFLAAAGGEPEFSSPEERAWLEEALIHVRAAEARRADVVEVEIPSRLTATQHVALERDPAAFAVNVLRPMPRKPNQFARRGTSFHSWVEQYYAQATQFLIADDELPGSGDEEEQGEQSALREAFLSSHWARRTAEAVEVPFSVVIGGQSKVGKMDAVFRDDDGWTVVDWKTGAKPGGRNPDSAEARKHRDDVAIQLAIYRIAWARILEQRTGKAVDPESIRGAFHYIGSGEDVFPENLPSEAELVARFEKRFRTDIDGARVAEAMSDGAEVRTMGAETESGRSAVESPE
ncbi:ATP-dependent DNA helicase [Dietzia sp.]|uniref:ATP-dependent DNA helicase n=1 Tax=Dietzia sp. TaxID=1871616 RepID=UPI002FDA7292